MFPEIMMLVGGLVLILLGANYMTGGAASLARRMGMSDFMVGLTIVSIMTSAPELVVSIMSAFNASAEMAVGNIVGSNIFNIFVIVGVVALVRPIKVEAGILANEIPLVVLSSVVLLVIGCAPFLDPGSPMVLTRVDGLILMLFFIVFMRYTVSSAKKEKPAAEEKKREMPLWRGLVSLFGGLAALVFGGDWFVDGASGIARVLGLSDAIIGLTIIAAGTSLPELATSVAAALRGYPGMCIGNVIGSCIFNIFFVLGFTSTILPLQFGSIGVVDLVVLTLSSVLFWVFGRHYGQRTITRAEGAFMLAGYVAYIAWLCYNAL